MKMLNFMESSLYLFFMHIYLSIFFGEMISGEDLRNKSHEVGIIYIDSRRFTVLCSCPDVCVFTVAFKIYDMDKDGYISNGELFQVLKMMVGNNLKDAQLQQIVDKTIIHADADGDGKISFEEFCAVSNTFDVTMSFY